MKVILIRHPESTKNLNDGTFGGPNIDFALTTRGCQHAEDVANRLTALVPILGSTSVWTSPDVRASHCAGVIVQRLRCSLRIEPRLRGIDGGATAGRRELDVERDDPFFWRSLALYRAGASSGYQIPTGGESVRQLEARVGAALDQIEASRSNTAVVITHRSAITASVIRYARRYHGYPRDFYGYVNVPLASVAVIETGGEAPGIRKVGAKVDEGESLN